MLLHLILFRKKLFCPIHFISQNFNVPDVLHKCITSNLVNTWNDDYSSSVSEIVTQSHNFIHLIMLLIQGQYRYRRPAVV